MMSVKEFLLAKADQYPCGIPERLVREHTANMLEYVAVSAEVSVVYRRLSDEGKKLIERALTKGLGLRTDQYDLIQEDMFIKKLNRGLINSRVILLCGSDTAKSCLGRDKVKLGVWYGAYGSKAIGILEPDYVVRNPDAKRELWNQLKVARNELE